MKKPEENIGLSSYEALGYLHDDIAHVLSDFSKKNPSRWECMKNILNHKNELSRFSFISVFYTLLISFSLVFSSFFADIALYGNLAGQGVFIFSICILNIFLVSWDNQLRFNEVPERVRSLLDLIQECQQKCHWSTELYPNLATPFSPCITLQWTYRDRKLVNLPWALLVRGDVIVLRPGQTSPGNVIQQDNQSFFLSSGEVYNPPQKHESITAPTARAPLKNKRFVLTETPLLKNVKEVMEASLSKNSVTSYDKQVHLITVKFLQNTAVPVFIFCIFLLGVLRAVYVEQWIQSPHWSVTFLLTPACVVIPIVPIVFPAAWIALHALGNAKLSAFLQSSSTDGMKEPFEDVSIDDERVEEVNLAGKWSQHFISVLLGRQYSLALSRSSNPLHILGSVTALCCVDKKGILSWPNPTAEKVFFLKTGNKANITRDTTINETASEYGQEEIRLDTGEGEGKTNDRILPELSSATRVEVLDLTHDLSSPFKLHFDDPAWSEHLGSLKPLGLSVLLNTCNLKTQEHYIQFCAHVTCEALYNEDLVPVTNRRCPFYYCRLFSDDENVHPDKKCLCELAKLIGFSEHAKNRYHLQEQLCTFRHVQAEAVRRDIKFARSLALASKLKLPFPHMVAVVVSHGTSSGPTARLQLFSQATGDIALDSCVDYWDGFTVRALSSSDKKKIADFNQRYSASAYCSVMTYRPLARPVSSELSKVYMELPADSNALYLKNRSPSPQIIPHPSEHLSCGDIAEEVSDIEGCFEMQCNQIFLGMITMQYQAKSDMVHLIEQLEKACIRFVHFSKENELRSRVFSEKMGLESGWNCHISLLSSSGGGGDEEAGAGPCGGGPHPTQQQQHDTGARELEDWEQSCHPQAPLLGATLCSLEGSRAMSVSAPCAINTHMSKDDPDGMKIKEEEFEVISQDGWQSLSCLSDSTEQSAPINFDMSNRAKLPRGIDQIRPHLEQVDNVPLLVSLFTDCTPRTTEQMIDIMQDYGEIVCVMGSSANADNSSIFLKANASVSVEPMYPQVCQKVPVFGGSPDFLSPSLLSTRLNSLPCCVAITRQRPLSLLHLIMQARHYMLSLWNCIQFWICSVVALCFIQLITILIMLPPLLNPGEVLWLSLVVIPLLSFSLVHSPTNPQVMQKPVAKVQSSLNSQAALFVAWCYCTKFLPTLLFTPLVYGLSLASFCGDISAAAGNASSCTMVFPQPLSPMGGWLVHSYPFATAQLLATSLLVLHLVIVSVSFVHREYLSWRRNPFKNRTWFLTSISLIGLQAVYLLSWSLLLASGGGGDEGVSRGYQLSVPWVSLALGLASLPLIFLFNELIKWQEIKANLRYEKRARLDFGTKLGMNSPF